MSAPGFARRLGVFALFATLAGAGVFLLRPPASVKVPADKDLAALEAAMIAKARLHPALPQTPSYGSAPYCVECHPLPPHPGGGVAAAMLNEHAAGMDCLLCHWPPEGGARPATAWQVPAGAPLFLALPPAERSGRKSLEALRSAATATGRCFDRGPGCAQCHRPGGMASLVRPGSAPGRARALESLEKYFTLAPGEKWYFPQLQ